MKLSTRKFNDLFHTKIPFVWIKQSFTKVGELSDWKIIVYQLRRYKDQDHLSETSCSIGNGETTFKACLLSLENSLSVDMLVIYE